MPFSEKKNSTIFSEDSLNPPEIPAPLAPETRQWKYAYLCTPTANTLTGCSLLTHALRCNTWTTANGLTTSRESRL